jgi:hypothetical protein
MTPMVRNSSAYSGFRLCSAMKEWKFDRTSTFRPYCSPERMGQIRASLRCSISCPYFGLDLHILLDLALCGQQKLARLIQLGTVVNLLR